MTEVNNDAILEAIPVTTQMMPAVPTPQGKTFSEDYVHTIREEAKENRIARKTAEEKAKDVNAKFKALIGLTEEDSLDDAKIAEYQRKQKDKETAVMQKANNRLIEAEIKSLDGYDSKLIMRLLDKSKLEIGEDGTVTGLQEAVEALAVEFPSVKVSVRRDGSNPPPPNTKTFDDQYEDLKKEILKHPNDSSLVQKLFLMKERK